MAHAARYPTPSHYVTEHPLWETQVALERGMTREGAERARDRETVARERGQMTRLQPVRGLVSEWLPTVASAVTEWKRSFARQRGPRPISLPLLQDADPYVVSLIAIRIVLDGLTIGRPAVTGLFMEVGRTVEHELQVRAWEESEDAALKAWRKGGREGERPPALFRAVQKRLTRETATSHHRSIVNIHTFNDLLAKGTFSKGWRKWTQDEHFHVGYALVNAIVMATQWFEFVPDPEHVYKTGRKRGPKLTLAPRPGLEAWLAETLSRAAELQPAYTPTVIPPKRWESTRGGGYWTPYVKTPRLVRFKASQEEQRERAADDYDAVDMPQVYAAVNFVQEVPWRVNERVFAVMQGVVAQDLALAGVPLLSREGHRMPDRPAGMPDEHAPKAEQEAWGKANAKEFRSWKRRVSGTIRRNIKLLSTQRGFARTFGIAQQYRAFEQFYFPHMLDFRGRMYPIPVGLQPQGDDVARGLLEFADGKEITEENGGAGWLAVNLASAFGVDKVSFEERTQWVQDNEPRWRRIAADPLGELDWCQGEGKADKPWQALAAILDWVALLDHGYGYISHAPVAVDGTCNGIQHLAAMTRDEVAGAYVNLVPGDHPRDIYKFVAQGLQEELERIEASGGEPGAHAAYWLNLCYRDLPRSLTKRQVMVLPYGGTKDSFFQYTREWLDKHDPLDDAQMDDDELTEARTLRTQRVTFLTLLLWDTVNARIKGPVVVMKWLQDVAKQAMSGNQPIFWVAPTGFVVRHFYGKRKERQVEVMLNGVRAQLVVQQTTKDLDTKAQLQGIAPNFVHAQDAAALTLSVIKAAAAGIAGFTAVHDAYGTHAADMWTLFRLLREAFVEVHEADPLGTFRHSAARVLVDAKVSAERLNDPQAAFEAVEERLPRMLELGSLDLSQVTESDYFFS